MLNDNKNDMIFTFFILLVPPYDMCPYVAVDEILAQAICCLSSSSASTTPGLQIECSNPFFHGSISHPDTVHTLLLLF
jgi:hypothetical protein